MKTKNMESVEFDNGTIKMAGNLHLPSDFDAHQRYAAVVVVHPGGGVKEQTARLYPENSHRRDSSP